MNVLFVASELAPYAKTGGLADVMAALPRYLHRAGHDVRVFIPLYDTIDTRKTEFRVVLEGIDVQLGAHRYRVNIVAAGSEPEIHFVHCPALYSRGAIYTHDADEHRRFLALCWAAMAACQRMLFSPDIIHCHDWQASLLPLIRKTRFDWDRLFTHSKTLLTIHNLYYQGIFPAATIADTGLADDSAHLFHQEQLRDGRVNHLLHGILYADGISTVSPTYAREMQTPEHGAHLDEFLRHRSMSVVGILNGADYEVWSPERDTHIPQRYDMSSLDLKEQNKEALLAKLGLPYVQGVPVLGIVSRLAAQKGFGLIGDVMPAILRRGECQMVVLGTGEAGLESMFGAMQRAFPKQVCFYQGFQDSLAHLIEAGADMFLMPSRYEPCGLNQMYSLCYGTVPIVHKTGGLADTVWQYDPGRDLGTGFVFEHFDEQGLAWAINRALDVWGSGAGRERERWTHLQRRGMALPLGWSHRVGEYVDLYRKLQPR